MLNKTSIFSYILIFLTLLLTPLGHARENTYKDKARGFALSIPVGWEALGQKEDAPAVVLRPVVKPEKGPTPTMMVSLIKERPPMPQTQEELQMIVGALVIPTKNLPGIKKLKIVGSKIENRLGERAFSYKTSYLLKRGKKSKTKEMMQLNWVFTDVGRYFAISLIIPKKKAKDFEKIGYSVFKSFRAIQAE